MMHAIMLFLVIPSFHKPCTDDANIDKFLSQHDIMLGAHMYVHPQEHMHENMHA